MPATLPRPTRFARPVRVVLADSHPMMRSTLRLLIEAEHDLHVVGEAGDLETAVRQSRGLRPDVLVLDLLLLAGSGRLALAHLRDALPASRLVAVTMEDSPGLARHSLAGGASAFVVKDRADSELADAVRDAARGRQYVGPTLRAKLSAERATPRALEPAGTLR